MPNFLSGGHRRGRLVPESSLQKDGEPLDDGQLAWEYVEFVVARPHAVRVRYSMSRSGSSLLGKPAPPQESPIDRQIHP